MEVMPNSLLWGNKWMRCDAKERFNDSKMPLFGETKRKIKNSDSSRINEEGGKEDQLATNMHIQKEWLQISFHGWGCSHFFHSFINSKSNSRNGGESNRAFWVKSGKLPKWILCVCMQVSQKWCPGFKSRSLKWAHHKKKKPRVWHRAGSLCSYEAQNLMSMNNEYYSTCWWLSGMPVIRSAKALFSWKITCWLSDATEEPLS